MVAKGMRGRWRVGFSRAVLQPTCCAYDCSCALCCALGCQYELPEKEQRRTQDRGLVCDGLSGPRPAAE